MPEAVSETTTNITNQPNQEPTYAFEQFLRMVEGGQLHSDLSNELRELNAEMNNHAMSYGGNPKGKITIEFNLKLENGVFDIVAAYKVKKPEAPRERTIAWSTPGNNFCASNPRQMTLPGVVRDVTSTTRGDVRHV